MKEEKGKARSHALELTTEILPLKDFVIKQNDFYLEIKQGQRTYVPDRYLENLKTEKVIKE